MFITAGAVANDDSFQPDESKTMSNHEAYIAKMKLQLDELDTRMDALDAKANILLPSRLAGHKVDEDLYQMIVSSLGITNRLHHFPSQLSGGQQQRVALARALVAAPAIIVADEPTGNLDSASTDEVLSLLRSAVDDLGQTIIMVTHDHHVAQRSDRVIVVRDGRIAADLWKPSAEQIKQVA